MNFDSTLGEKELDILREAVDKAEETAAKKLINSDSVQEIIDIVEQFLRKKKLVCYGGTAINNILPVEDQFYDKSTELPDYDFFSSNALENAKELADIYAKHGYDDVEAKTGVHHGTFKVFVNFIPVADITSLPKNLFKSIQNKSIKVDGIAYAPPDYLRMAMYLELSRPKGDVSRWEKVLKRLTLLNKNFPMRNPKCNHDNFMRSFEGPKEQSEKIYYIVKKSIIDLGLVFFGGYASKLYSKFMPRNLRQKLSLKNPDFDVLALNPERAAIIIKERLEMENIKDVKIKKQKNIGEIISDHYEITIKNDTVAFIYKPLACHSFNKIYIKGREVKVATIDTMLSFYLAFLFANRSYYDHDRIYCMSQYLYLVQSKNRLAQKGVLKRFSLNCVGDQITLESMRNEKSKKFEELKGKRGTKEYEDWFLKYSPSQKKTLKKKTLKKKTLKKKKTKKN
tara:strand:- start:1760 stop:3118 length:1359 start_codon:yes stop_codon:yes gene_type:complete